MDRQAFDTGACAEMFGDHIFLCLEDFVGLYGKAELLRDWCYENRHSDSTKVQSRRALLEIKIRDFYEARNYLFKGDLDYDIEYYGITYLDASAVRGLAMKYAPIGILPNRKQQGRMDRENRKQEEGEQNG